MPNNTGLKPENLKADREYVLGALNDMLLVLDEMLPRIREAPPPDCDLYGSLSGAHARIERATVHLHDWLGHQPNLLVWDMSRDVDDA